MSNQSRILELRQALSRVIVGQDTLLDRLVIGLLADGHVLVQPHATGRVAVPTLRLPWYDVGRGQVAGVAISGRTLTVFYPRWRVAGQVAGGVAAVLLAIIVVWWLRRVVRWRLARWRNLRAIRVAADTVQLARAVRQFSPAGQPEAPSPGAWQRRMQQETGNCVDGELVVALEARCYGHALLTGEADVRAAWERALSSVRPASCSRWD